MKVHWLPLLVLVATGCKDAALEARLPTVSEVPPETVLVNYAPRSLRMFPEQNPQRYVVIASERPEMPAVWRPLAVFDHPFPAPAPARAGSFAWIAGHVVMLAAKPDGSAELLVYDRDGKTAEHKPLSDLLNKEGLAPCGPQGTLLVQSRWTSKGEILQGVIPCGKAAQTLVFVADGNGTVSWQRKVADFTSVDLFFATEEATYLLSDRKVVRLGTQGEQTIGTVPPPLGGPDTRELLQHGDELLVIDGAAGRMIRMGARDLRWRKEHRLPVTNKVTRLRAALLDDRVLLAFAEEGKHKQPEDGTDLFAFVQPLSEKSPVKATRYLLGQGPLPSDHEVVSADGKGALLLRTHRGNTGPLVALARLNF